MAGNVRTEHPHVVRVREAGAESPIIKGTRLSVALIAALYNRGETPAGLMILYPNLTPSALYDALSYYFDHKAEVDQEIRENDPEQVLAEIRSDPGMVEVRPGHFERMVASPAGT